MWAIGVAVAAARTPNPVVLALLGAAVLNVAVARRQPGPAGRAVGVFVRLGLVVIAIRVPLTVLVGARVAGHDPVHGAVGRTCPTGRPA